MNPYTLCIAPMMDWTDTHYRTFARLISPHARLYTEMVTSHALLHGNQKRLLAFNASEHPLALQLGGSHPKELATCARIGENMGFDEVNLNVGCPSDRVQSGRFGACLMKEPALVAECISEMAAATRIPITVKHRIGVDHLDSYEQLTEFVSTVKSAGCSVFIVHARKAWLSGLSPKENREIPPLHYDVVYQLKHDFPELTIVINGGITHTDACRAHLQQVDGIMLGRSAYHDPYLLAEIERTIFNHPEVPSRRQAIEDFIPYIEKQLAEGLQLNHITRHILGLYQGQKGARAFRRHLSEQAHQPGASVAVLRTALQYIDPKI